MKVDVLGASRLPMYRNIDADDFKERLLKEAASDGSLERWLTPDAVRVLEGEGHRFFPLELASLIHEESSYLARRLRDRAIDAGDNIIVDTVLGGEEKHALELGERLAAEGYRVDVVDVEVPFELSEQRIRQRWEIEYVAALAGEEASLGGRWVPSEYARDVFDGPGGRTKPEHNARLLAEQCPAVAEYRLYRTGMDQAHVERAVPVLEEHWQRSRPGSALESVQTPQDHTRGASVAGRDGVRDVSFPDRSRGSRPHRPEVSRQPERPQNRDRGLER